MCRQFAPNLQLPMHKESGQSLHWIAIELPVISVNITNASIYVARVVGEVMGGLQHCKKFYKTETQLATWALFMLQMP